MPINKERINPLTYFFFSFFTYFFRSINCFVHGLCMDALGCSLFVVVSLLCSEEEDKLDKHQIKVEIRQYKSGGLSVLLLRVM